MKYQIRISKMNFRRYKPKMTHNDFLNNISTVCSNCFSEKPGKSECWVVAGNCESGDCSGCDKKWLAYCNNQDCKKVLYDYLKERNDTTKTI